MYLSAALQCVKCLSENIRCQFEIWEVKADHSTLSLIASPPNVANETSEGGPDDCSPSSEVQLAVKLLRYVEEETNKNPPGRQMLLVPPFKQRQLSLDGEFENLTVVEAGWAQLFSTSRPLPCPRVFGIIEGTVLGHPLNSKGLLLLPFNPFPSSDREPSDRQSGLSEETKSYGGLYGRTSYVKTISAEESGGSKLCAMLSTPDIPFSEHLAAGNDFQQPDECSMHSTTASDYEGDHIEAAESEVEGRISELPLRRTGIKQKFRAVAMELIEGIRLTEVLKEVRKNGVRTVAMASLLLDIAAAIVRGYSTINKTASSILPWDVKPGNIIVQLYRQTSLNGWPANFQPLISDDDHQSKRTNFLNDMQEIFQVNRTGCEFRESSSSKPIRCHRAVIVDLGDALRGPLHSFSVINSDSPLPCKATKRLGRKGITRAASCDTSCSCSDGESTPKLASPSPAFICSKAFCSPECAMILCLAANHPNGNDALRDLWGEERRRVADWTDLHDEVKRHLRGRWRPWVFRGYLSRGKKEDHCRPRSFSVPACFASVPPPTSLLSTADSGLFPAVVVLSSATIVFSVGLLIAQVLGGKPLPVIARQRGGVFEALCRWQMDNTLTTETNTSSSSSLTQSSSDSESPSSERENCAKLPPSVARHPAWRNSFSEDHTLRRPTSSGERCNSNIPRPNAAARRSQQGGWRPFSSGNSKLKSRKPSEGQERRKGAHQAQAFDGALVLPNFPVDIWGSDAAVRLQNTLRSALRFLPSDRLTWKQFEWELQETLYVFCKRSN